ncbi:SCP domain-containing protein [Aphelenchoides bicaudatus]|nr:SCP domain-containing protein [Aphelenchoides bicaudatus]
MNSKIVLLFVLIVCFVCLCQSKLSKKIRKQVAKQQNKVRSKVAKGKFANGTSGTNLPKAGNMMQLAYSKLLEKNANVIAKNCYIFQVSGVNYFVAAGTVKPGAALKNATSTWAAELNGNATLPSLKYSASSSNGTSISNFTQLIWAKSKLVGCSVQNCASGVNGSSITGASTLVVCQYTPEGNQDGKAIYKKSKKPGQKCPKKTKRTKSGLCKAKKTKLNFNGGSVSCQQVCKALGTCTCN